MAAPPEPSGCGSGLSVILDARRHQLWGYRLQCPASGSSHEPIADLQLPALGKNAPIVVVGAGYVGLITAVGFAKVRSVRLVDEKAELIGALSAGTAPIWEPGLQDRLDAALAAGRLAFGTSTKDVVRDLPPSLIFVAVGTPTEPPWIDADGVRHRGEAADLKHVHKVIDALRGLNGGHAIVMKSTVPPGTGASLVRRIREGGGSLTYISCPEFLQEGEAFRGLDRPDRIVVGCDAKSPATDELRELHRELYADLEPVDRPRYIEMSVESAELVKLSSNLALAVKISLANEIGNICEEFGADVNAVTEGIGSDQRIGPDFLRAGVGFGGSCFEKDLRSLRREANRAKVETSLVDAALDINARQARRVIEKLVAYLGTLEDRCVALLGLTFKAHTDDLRGSPAFTLAKLLRWHGAVVQAWDPCEEARARAVVNSEQATPPRERLQAGEVAFTAIEALEGAHAAVVVTAWPDLQKIDWDLAAKEMRGDYVLDGRNALDPLAVRAAGLVYEGTGRESAGLQRSLLEARQP
jgi:UDPglucose 6-dehydrogenase